MGFLVRRFFSWDGPRTPRKAPKMKCEPISAVKFVANPAKTLGAVYDPNFEYRITDTKTPRHAERLAEGWEPICHVITTNAESLMLIGKPKGAK